MESDRKHRRRLRVAFENWVTTQPGPPLVVLPALSANSTSAVYALAGVIREIVICVSRDISVAAMRGDACWDLLTVFDTLPQKEANGQWKCGFPDSLALSRFASAEALLQANLFNPLADWIKNTLHRAQWLELHEAHGATWAYLETETRLAPPNLVARFRVHAVE